MHHEGESVHVSEEEASGGSKEGVVRWVLIVGTLLAIAALSFIWITGAATRDDPDADHATVNSDLAAENRRTQPGTDSVVAPANNAQRDQNRVKDGLPVVEN